jgi:hypothetical protein
MTPNPADGKFATFSCSYCGQHIEFPAIMAHESTSCPACNQTIKFPANEFWAGPVSAEKQAVRIAQCESLYTSGLDEDSLYNEPCWEYLPFYGGEPLIDWPARWQKAGGPVRVESRFIAPKSHAVWKNLGNQEIFPDALGNPFPPYVNGSGYGWIGQGREECIALGVIDAADHQESHYYSLLGELMADKPHATLADIAADRAGLLRALAHLKEAELTTPKQQGEQAGRLRAEYERRNQQASDDRAEKSGMFCLLETVERSLRETTVVRDGKKWNWLCDSIAKLTTTKYFDEYPNWRARAWASSATMYGSIGIPKDELACLKRALELNPQLGVKRRIKALDRLVNGSEESKPL